MTDKFINKNVVITGAANGLGQVVALEFAREGANLILLDVNDCSLTQGMIPNADAITIPCDISSESDVIQAAEEIGKVFNGRIDVLINNAGLNGKTNLIKDMKLDDWNRTIGVNLTGTMLVCRELIKYLVQNGGGQIVNVASNVGKRGLPYRADYVCSKWALLGFTQTLALELADENIRVNAVCPGPIEGERIEQLVQMHADVEGISYDEMYKAWENVPMKRFIKPHEVADVIMFLASGQSSSMTGQALNVTGGMIMS
jgi:NAD(P)-dependent dehydrogenase (short-subunit alcohol dehydrogenase family)